MPPASPPGVLHFTRDDFINKPPSKPNKPQILSQNFYHRWRLSQETTWSLYSTKSSPQITTEASVVLQTMLAPSLDHILDPQPLSQVSRWCFARYRIFNLFWHDKLIILGVFAREINSDKLTHLAKHVQFYVKSTIDSYLCQ